MRAAFTSARVPERGASTGRTIFSASSDPTASPRPTARPASVNGTYTPSPSAPWPTASPPTVTIHRPPSRSGRSQRCSRGWYQRSSGKSYPSIRATAAIDQLALPEARVVGGEITYLLVGNRLHDGLGGLDDIVAGASPVGFEQRDLVPEIPRRLAGQGRDALGRVSLAVLAVA